MKKTYKFVNTCVYSDKMVQVQLRVPEMMVKELDRLVETGKFRSRSEAIKAAILLYQEREKTLEFYKMLFSRSKEARENPELLVPFEEI